jgi:hypothetical protein
LQSIPSISVTPFFTPKAFKTLSISISSFPTSLKTSFTAEIDTETHCHENVLNAMKSDKRFCMEEDEPLCKNKLPREGIVLRINDDPMAEAFKLKCLKFLGKEAEDIDKGRSDDIEMQERYTDDSSDEN